MRQWSRQDAQPEGDPHPPRAMKMKEKGSWHFPLGLVVKETPRGSVSVFHLSAFKEQSSVPHCSIHYIGRDSLPAHTYLSRGSHLGPTDGLRCL